MEFNVNESEEYNSKSFKLFDLIRESDFNQYDKLILLKEFTNDYDIDLLKALKNDIDFYLFVEKNEKECEFTSEDITNEIERRNKKTHYIPIHKTKNLKDESVNRINMEELLFPYEFIQIKSFRNLIVKKLEESKPINKEVELIDWNESKGTEKIIMLYKLGILDFLKDKEPFNTSTNALANVISGITGEKQTSVYPMINTILKPLNDQGNNPLNTDKTVSKVIQKLISIGFTPKN